MLSQGKEWQVALTLAYLCSKCGRPHSLTEFRESRFCRNCGKLLTYGDRTLLGQGTQSAASALEKTYEIVRSSILHSELLDSVEVVKQVERYRQFWRPKIVNVVLLAESHVYIDEQECRVRCRTSILDDIFLPENRDYPTNFVKLVYCLGYGENWLLERAIDDNSGTWQFWKIFSSCVAEDKGDLGFDKILKTKTRNNHQRLPNKVDVLRKMKAKGIWLLDASIVGIYKSGLGDYPAEYNTILRLCWDNYS